MPLKISLILCVTRRGCSAMSRKRRSRELPPGPRRPVASLYTRAMELPPGPRSPAVVNSLRFAYRPLAVLREWRRRFGDVFTVRFLGFGAGVYVADPEAIRELFTGDQSDLRAGEANSFMEPVLGANSVLVLDGPEHLRQRKLLLPPFQ
jgi:cytochrome P450 family 135